MNQHLATAALFAAALIPLGGSALASTAEAEKRLRSAVDQIVEVVTRSANGDELAKAARPILERAISFEAMTRRAIGPGWRQFSKGQQKEATSLFTTLIIRSYSSKFTPGGRPSVEYLPAVTPAAGRVEIPTTTLYKGSRYSITYRLEQAEGWRITDVVVEGVSLIANYRTQFDAQYKKGGADAVIRALTQAVAAPK